MSANNECMRALIREFTISILLPPVQLVITCQRDTLLEATLRVCRPSNGESPQLCTRPSESRPRLIRKTQTIRRSAISKSSDTLVSDQINFFLTAASSNAASWSADQRRNALCPTKGATSPFAACHRDTLVDTPGEVRNTILESSDARSA
jgi:hypothetical protein